MAEAPPSGDLHVPAAGAVMPGPAAVVRAASQRGLSARIRHVPWPIVPFVAFLALVILVAISAPVLAPYDLGPDGAIHAVRGLRAIAHGFATIEQAGGFGLAPDRDESFTRLVRAFIAGLRAP